MVCIDLPEISFCNVNPLRLSLGPRHFCTPSSILKNHMDGRRAPANLGPSLNHLAIGHSNCTAATCCFMPFRNPSFPPPPPSERASRPFDAVGFLPSIPLSAVAFIHSIDDRVETTRRRNLRSLSHHYSAVALLASPSPHALPPSPSSCPLQLGSVPLHVIVHSEHAGWGPLTS